MSTLGEAADVNPVIKFLPHSATCVAGTLPLLTCSPSAWPSRLPYRRGRKSLRDLWITLYFEKTQVLLKSGKNRGALHVDLRKFMIVPRCIILRIRNVSDKYCTEIRVLILWNFILKTVPFVRWCGKNGRAGEVTDENKAYALCMLDD